jgi:hypothetical protein
VVRGLVSDEDAHEWRLMPRTVAIVVSHLLAIPDELLFVI